MLLDRHDSLRLYGRDKNRLFGFLLIIYILGRNMNVMKIRFYCKVSKEHKLNFNNWILKKKSVK